jgi:hypothetical protein
MIPVKEAGFLKRKDSNSNVISIQKDKEVLPLSGVR